MLGPLFFLRCAQEVLSRGDHTNPNKQTKLLSKMFFFSFHLAWLIMLSLPFSSPSLSLLLVVLIITKPCHHGSCGHVNQPGQRHLFPAVYLQPNKGVCLFVVAGVECCVGWGLLFNSARCYQPPSLNANSTQGINGIGGKERICQCGGCRTLRNYKQSFFPKGAKTDGAQRRQITSKREKQINSCASPPFSAQVYAGAVLRGGGGSVCVSRGGLASVGRSCEVSFASANETEPGWPMSPWQQAISTSLSAILAAMVVCLLVSLHPASLHHSTAGLITTAVVVAESTWLDL